jgi:hypothetical protein
MSVHTHYIPTPLPGQLDGRDTSLDLGPDPRDEPDFEPAPADYQYRFDEDAAPPWTESQQHETAPGWPEPPDEAAFHGILGVIVNAVAPYTEADRVALLGSLLAAVGAYVGSGWALHQGDWQRANVFVALVGETGIGRKGTAFGAVKEIMHAVDREWHHVLVPGLGSGEGLITYLKEHADDPRALVHEPEFGRLLTAMARDGSTVSPVIRNAWDGVPLGRHVASAKASATIYDHHVGVLANITDVELAQKLKSVDAANGFGNRFLWLAVRRAQLVPFTEPVSGHVSPFVASLKRSLAFASGSGFARLTPAAKDRWEVFYRGRVPRAGLIGALTGRAEPYVARLALLYALLDGKAEVDAQHLAAAEALWAYAERSAVYIFGESTGNPDADALLRLLELQSPLTWWEASKELGVYRSSDMEAIVGLLVRLGRVGVVKVTRAGGGRPRREIELLGANSANA